MIYQSISEMIGSTPMLKASRFVAYCDLNTNILAKLEYLNPAGSAKDRVAREIIDEAEKRGEIKADTVIIEPTSGNTGIGLAAIAASRGYRAIFVMPDTMSIERQNILKALGSEVVLTPGAEGMDGSIKKANELAGQYQSAFIAGQFENPDNARAHEKTTGPEIWADTAGKIDIFIASVGTGGTITGTGHFLKNKKPDIKIIAVEPAGSPMLSKGEKGPHKIQGIGAGFIPKVLDTGVYDEVVAVDDDDAFSYSKAFAKAEGITVGISSGAVLAAAVQVAKRPENKGKNIVVLLTDGGDRYYSTKLFNE